MPKVRRKDLAPHIRCPWCGEAGYLRYIAYASVEFGKTGTYHSSRLRCRMCNRQDSFHNIHNIARLGESAFHQQSVIDLRYPEEPAVLKRTRARHAIHELVL